MQDYFSFRQQSHRLYLQLFTPLLERYGLTQTEMDILLYLANHPPHCTAAQLISHRGLTKSHVSMSLASLQEKGYLTCLREAGDRRRIRLTLLPAAEAPAAEGRRQQERFKELLLAGFSSREREQMVQMLQRMTENAGAACKTKTVQLQF